MIATVLILGSYLLGSVCFGLLWAAYNGVDIRAHGSGNVGATNIGRILGKKAWASVLLLDLSKGVVSVAISGWFADETVVATSAFAVVLGHCFPLYFGFRGGKGVATGVGATLTMCAPAGVVALAIFALVRRARVPTSGASLAGVVAAPAMTLLVRGPDAVFFASAAIGALILIRHHDNIRRLIQGTEPS